MTTFYLTLGALAVSALAILALCIGDPKRRRAMGHRDGGMSSGQRWGLVATACLPSFTCMVLGDAAAFLMWLGGCVLVGWALAVGLRPSTVKK